MQTSETWIDLREAGARSAGAVGSKARTLGRLAEAGFPVPEGAVIPPDVEDAALPDLLDRIRRRLGTGPLAVRSSAAAEDLPDRSYAGLYETVLGVEGREELIEAVRRCRASARAERVIAYHGGEPPPMAVIVQRLVPAEVAGVAFTADPVTGERDVTVIEAVSGLGDRLVSGEATPEEWEVREGTAGSRSAPDGVLDADTASRVDRLARRVEDHLGDPQDVEWALAGGGVHLLQARPITGLPDVEPAEPRFDPPERGFWMLDGAHYPTPISPMAASFYLGAIDAASTAGFKEFGAMIERVESRVFGWRPYVRIVPPGEKEGSPPPWWVMGLAVRILPPMRRAIRRARQAVRSDLSGRYIDRWREKWRPALRNEIRSLGGRPLGDLSDQGLLEHFRETLTLVERGQEIHFRLAIPFMRPVYRLVRFCTDELGWPKGRATDLLAGLSAMSSEPVRRLDRLADLIEESPAASLLGDGEPSLDELRAADDGVREALEDYLAEFGLRATAYDVIEPTVGERPELLMSLIADQLQGGFQASAVEEGLEERRREAEREARELLADRPEALARFEEILAEVERAYPVREDNIFYTDNAPLGLVRLAALEIGRRLADRDLLEEPDHVFFLEGEEAVDALVRGVDHRERVERRRRERLWATAHRPAPSLGEDPGPLPDLRAVPVEAREVMEALMWFAENDLAAPAGDGLSGVGASPGTYTGPVRVVRGEEDFGKVRPGDVLVAPVTTPAWSVLFGRIGALVTDTGGLLSHAAIVAREHAIPAVVATGSGTELLTDGQRVTVDGSAGRIELHD